MQSNWKPLSQLVDEWPQASIRPVCSSDRPDFANVAISRLELRHAVRCSFESGRKVSQSLGESALITYVTDQRALRLFLPNLRAVLGTTLQLGLLIESTADVIIVINYP
jgi:hypothetical protein